MSSPSERWRPPSTGSGRGLRTTRGGHSPLQWGHTALTVELTLCNIEHFLRSLGSIMISGAQIRAARGLLGWTTRELARRATVSVQRCS